MISFNIAVSGTAISIPIKPRNCSPTKTTTTVVIGSNSTLFPTKSGVTKAVSMICTPIVITIIPITLDPTPKRESTKTTANAGIAPINGFEDKFYKIIHDLEENNYEVQ